MCLHGRQKNICKDCDGTSICEHNKRRDRCKDCKGVGICSHNRQKDICKECKGNQICEHNRIRNRCKECKGSQICEHNRIRSQCKECKGGGICEHNKRRCICKECKGGSICDHGQIIYRCKICDPNGYLVYMVRKTVCRVLKSDKSKRSLEYLGCTTETLRNHLEEQFEVGMSWENHGEWHIDHIIPIKYRENGENPSLEEIIKRLHYLNLQPMWAGPNMSKCNRFIG